MVILEIFLFLSKILIDPSVVKSFPYYLIYMENICFFCIVLFRFLLTLQGKGALWS